MLALNIIIIIHARCAPSQPAFQESTPQTAQEQQILNANCALTSQQSVPSHTLMAIAASRATTTPTSTRPTIHASNAPGIRTVQPRRPAASAQQNNALQGLTERVAMMGRSLMLHASHASMAHKILVGMCGLQDAHSNASTAFTSTGISIHAFSVTCPPASTRDSMPRHARRMDIHSASTVLDL